MSYCVICAGARADLGQLEARPERRVRGAFRVVRESREPLAHGLRHFHTQELPETAQTQKGPPLSAAPTLPFPVSLLGGFT